jgi:hypothetical protein
VNQIDNIMALADEYADYSHSNAHCHTRRQALRAAIEAALTPGGPVAWINWSALTGEPRLGWQCESEIASEPLYTAPQPQPKQEPVATVTLSESMGAEFKFNHPHTLLPGQVLYVYTAPQPQPEQRTAGCTLCGHCAATREKLPKNDTALLRQALEAMQTLLDAVQDKTVQMRTGVVVGGSAVDQATEAIAALRERLK